MYMIQRANERGLTHISWLKSFHSFSFGEYYDPKKMGFGPLRVINDDTILGGTGFHPHQHRDMEIISIPLKGGLLHQDSLGNDIEITPEMIQVMSAGTGIVHAEYNASQTDATDFLQIWIEPNQLHVPPRHVETKINYLANELTLLAGPNSSDQIQLYQEAYLFRGRYSEETQLDYTSKYENGLLYLFVIDGTVEINGEKLERRDAIAIEKEQAISLHLSSNADFLLFDMQESSGA